jgi:hypothetical protein
MRPIGQDAAQSERFEETGSLVGSLDGAETQKSTKFAISHGYRMELLKKSIKPKRFT